MGSTFFSLRYHLVFSTKNRRPYIRPEWRDRLHAYLGGIVRHQGGTVVATVPGKSDPHQVMAAALGQRETQ